MIRVVLPGHLRMLARVDGEVDLDVEGRAVRNEEALAACFPIHRHREALSLCVRGRCSA